MNTAQTGLEIQLLKITRKESLKVRQRYVKRSTIGSYTFQKESTRRQHELKNEQVDVNHNDQQQLAGIFDLTVWHFTQISSVSLQLSTQKGQKQATPPVKKRRQRHQRIVTQPIFFLGIWPVSLPQAMQGDPSPLLSFPPIVMMVGPCCCGGGGAYMGWAIIGWAIMGCPIIGCPYIFLVYNFLQIQLALHHIYISYKVASFIPFQFNCLFLYILYEIKIKNLVPIFASQSINIFILFTILFFKNVVIIFQVFWLFI